MPYIHLGEPSYRMKSKIACIFNYAPHYRHSIYHLMAKEFKCDFYFGKNLPNGEQLKKMDVKSLPGFKKESPVYQYRYVWQCNVVQQAFKGYRVYILTGSPSLSNILFMFFARLFKKKVFLWTHGYKNSAEGKHPLLQFFYKSATGFFLYGNYGKQIMARYGIPESRLFVVNNSLDYDRQLAVRNNLAVRAIYVDRFKNEDPVVIFSGRLLKYKRIEMILNAQKALISACPFNLVLVGDGPERSELERKADHLGITDRVWFHGECYDEEVVGNLFYNATLTVSPGNVGLTAIHSMMYGTPVLTHHNAENQGPEFEAIRPGQTGAFFKDGDLSDLTDNINNWITNFRQRETIRQKCFSMIDEFYNPNYTIKVIKQALYGS